MKEQKGITLITLVVTIIILIILAGISIEVTIGEDGIITITKKTKENIQIAINQEEEQLAKLENELTQREENIESSFDIEKGNNKPIVKVAMTPIKFENPTEEKTAEIIETSKDDRQWYDYQNKQWANARTQDGSMWVWIPRFAYKINAQTNTFDVVFLIGITDYYYDKNGNIQTARRCKSEEEIIDASVEYVVHPAFTDETVISYKNGGWDKEITGMWVTKFEAGYASRK